MDSPVNKSFQMGAWRVDPTRSEISQDGKVRVIRLQPRAMGILVCLASRPGEVVSIDDLLTEAWPGVIVTPDSVYQSVGALREALGDDPKNPTYIATVPRMGYRLVAPVTPATEPTAASTAPSILAPETKHVAPLAAGTARSNHAGTYVIALILLCALGFGVYRLTERRSAPATTASATSIAASNEPSIAVLPFLDMSESKDQQYFADGMTEELIDTLSKVPRLKVIARTSSYYFKDRKSTVAEIGKTLGVANVLEGSVRRSGDRWRITAQLVRADTGFHLWSETYDRPFNDIFKVQDAIAGEISKKLKASLTDDPPPQPVVPKNTDAYVWYLKALSMRHGLRGQAEAATIVEYLNKSIASDPGYAPAWAELSRALVYQVNGGFELPTAVNARAHEAAERAVVLDPQLAAAYVAAGVVHEFIDWDFAAAAQDYGRALSIAPNWPDLLEFFGNVKESFGSLEEARVLYERSIALDPLDERYYLDLGDIEFLLGQTDKSESQFNTALKLNPKMPDGYWETSFCRLARGDTAGALTIAKRNPQEPSRLWNLAIVYFAMGRTKESNDVLSELEKRYADDSAYLIAESYAYRGDVDHAFAWLNRSYRQRDVNFEHVNIDWQLKRLREDPRFHEFLRKIKFPESL
jgi:TolB-like protein/DNA-binding winged helix-turn-helix (wHTH) protein/tetratricopeptide (TPR) repeat protein